MSVFWPFVENKVTMERICLEIYNLTKNDFATFYQQLVLKIAAIYCAIVSVYLYISVVGY